MNALLVCSSGGHLYQLYALKAWWERHERLWVTFRKPDAESLLAGEAVAWAHHPTTRNLPNAARNLGLAWRLLRRRRPDVVVSTGAGVAFPFFLAARALGIRTVYLEVYDRIDLPTLTGRLCYPLSDLFLLQWEEQRRFYPRGRVIGPLLGGGGAAAPFPGAPGGAGGGTGVAGRGPRGDGPPLVFVTVGTDHHPFDRLVRWVDAWLEAGGRSRARCLMQTGTSVPPLHGEHRDYLTYTEMEAAIREARAVVCHGGPGTILLCRHLGKTPIVVPRERRRGEHVDDHQVAFSRRLAARGEIALAETEERFRSVLDEALGGAPPSPGPQETPETAPAVERFAERLCEIAAAPPPGGARGW